MSGHILWSTQGHGVHNPPDGTSGTFRVVIKLTLSKAKDCRRHAYIAQAALQPYGWFLGQVATRRTALNPQTDDDEGDYIPYTPLATQQSVLVSKNCGAPGFSTEAAPWMHQKAHVETTQNHQGSNECSRCA
jgi:hypothetical protein